MAIALQVSSNVTPNQNKHLINLWPQAMLENIWTFNQCAGLGAPLQTANDKAGKVYLQTEREYIARNLEAAADRMAGDLNYSLMPLYFTERIPIGSAWPVQGQYFQARWCKMIELGSRAQTLIQAGVAVTYTDPNSVGVNDTATVTVVTGIANAEIKLFFRTADGAPSAGDYRYEIEPTFITNSAGTVTITAHRALFVSPRQWAREYVANDPNFNSPNIVDTGTAAGFVTAVDVYRVYTDTSDNVELLSSDGSTVLQTYTAEILDYELSTFRIGDFCSSFNDCCGYPKFIQVNYKAGSPLVNNNIDSELFEAAVGFACGNMMSKLTAQSMWSLDLYNKYHGLMVETMNNQLVPTATKMMSSSQYGARYGQALAWSVVNDRRIMRGHKLTMNLG